MTCITWYYVLLVSLVGLDQVVGDSVVCGSGGNFSSVCDWTRISTVFRDNLNNSLSYQEIIDIFIKISDWVGPDRYYWGEECSCVQQLIHQPIDDEVLKQSEYFDYILKTDIIEWSETFDLDMEEIMVEKTSEINDKLRNILEDIQSNLKVTPERSALVSMDATVVSTYTLMGMISRAISTNVEPCTAFLLANQTLSSIQNLVEFSLENTRYMIWPNQVALCSVNLPETYEECQPPLPWPHYWVQDNYLGEQIFFGMQEEAEVFLSNYVDAVTTSVNSLVEGVEKDIWVLENASTIIQNMLIDYECNLDII